ncbi:MAG: SRPBCC domain-containing protein, partial [Chitinophagaceae bacterium]|nr:SRPBCC domain-containing protein [Chitinophagaceae bacterium]
LRPGGSFVTRMEAKDGSFGFDFAGVYDAVEKHKFISYTMGDGRRAEITFTDNGDSSSIVESFEAESENPLELQQSGWQAILDNFKRYAEAN